MGKRTITLDTPMDVVMNSHPEVLPVLLALRIHCIGCPLSSFHSVSDAALEHSRDPAELLASLRSAIAAADSG